MEQTVDHIESDVAELKADVRRLDPKVDAVKESVAALRLEMREGFAALRGEMKDAIAHLRLSRLVDRVWWLLTCAALLGVMARGFKWI